jgi:hypothetical protein
MPVETVGSRGDCIDWSLAEVGEIFLLRDGVVWGGKR